MRNDPKRICVVTSYTASTEPRAPRHAIAAKQAFPTAEVILLDLAAEGLPRTPEPSLLDGYRIKRVTINFPTRKKGIIDLAGRKLKSRVSQYVFSRFGLIQESVFGAKAQGLSRCLINLPADIYIAHNIETLLPAVNAAHVHGGHVVFDCMEFYSGMGDGQNPVEAAAARALEEKVLKSCLLVIASSDAMADALVDEYGIPRPLAAYNVPPIEYLLPTERNPGLKLYWRNSTIGFGQRGLEDILAAMDLLPSQVHLYLQGRLPPSSALALQKRISLLRLQNRVHVLPPYVSHEAVRNAAIHDVGLCLERKGPRNHDLTVSNKMFDYHMAGLATIATNLPALVDVINRSGGGIICRPNDPVSLANAVKTFIADPQLLDDLKSRSRRFALKYGNMEIEIDKISASMRLAFDQIRNRAR